jgi:pSer/pThr/pTyr-binding forkhead associated (FHA) protein
MGLELKIIDSTDSSVIGKVYEIQPGIVIGRAKGNIIIEDDRMSSVHAEIQVNNQGDCFLVDKDSRNGIKVEGKRITKLLLTEGQVFQIGNTVIEAIFNANPVKSTSNQELKEKNLFLEAERLISETSKSSEDFKPPVFFNDPLKLIVIQGLQLNQKWVLDYGPFKFGSGCVGGLLIGKNMPETVFELTQSASGFIIKPLTKSPIIFLNTVPLLNDSLIEKGDILSLEIPNEETTRIRFEF